MKPYYEDDWATIYRGDCLDVLPLKATVCITDPPYNLGIKYTNATDDSRSDFAGWIRTRFDAIRPCVERMYLTPGHTNVWAYPPADWLMGWFYGTTNSLNLSGFTSWQPILFYGKDPYLATGKGARMDVISDSHVAPRGGQHPCPKPIEFVRKLVVRGSADPSDVILDPFMGSGTTLRAAKDLGRKSIGIEIEEKYCEIAARRLEQEVFNFSPKQPKQDTAEQIQMDT